MKVSLGSRTNRYLAIWYGFALLDNRFDSYSFRMVIDDKVAKGAGLTHGVLQHYLTADEKKEGFISFNDYIIATELISVPLKAKMSELNMDLIKYLRAHLYPGWIKDHPLKKNSAYSNDMSYPFDLSYEVTIVKTFIEIFTYLLKTFTRSEKEDLKILTDEKLTDARRTVVITEHGWKRIIAEQIRLGELVLDVLRRSMDDSDTLTKKIYMERVGQIDRPEENPLSLRLKIKEYLKRLHTAPAFQYK